MPAAPRKPREGRRSPANLPRRRGRRPKLNYLQRHQRGREIAAMRALDPPVAWKDIAERVGMSVEGAQDARNQFLLAEESMMNGPQSAVVDETIDLLTVAVDGLLRNAEAAPAGSSVRAQSFKVAADTVIERLRVMRAAGKAPRSLNAPAVGQQLQVAYRRFAELLQRYDVGDDALREFLELAESQLGSERVVEGEAREIESAA